MKIFTILPLFSIVTCAVISTLAPTKFQSPSSRVRGTARVKHVRPAHARIGTALKPVAVKSAPREDVEALALHTPGQASQDAAQTIRTKFSEPLLKWLANSKTSTESANNLKCPPESAAISKALKESMSAEALNEIGVNTLSKREFNPETIELWLQYNLAAIVLSRCILAPIALTINQNVGGWVTLESGVAGWFFINILMPLISESANHVYSVPIHH